MNETPFFFPSGAYELYGVLHQPARVTGPGFVFCHPLGEEKLWSHRVLVSFARTLANAGCPVLRFDYRGNGDSSGEFAEADVDAILSDVDCAIDTLEAKTGIDEVALLGLRFGGTAAAQIAERRADVRRLVLWAPIVEGARYMQDLLRINLSTQLAVYREIRADREALVGEFAAGRTVNIEGYEFSPRMYEQIAALKIAGARRAFAGPVLVTQIERAATAKPAVDLLALTATYGAAAHRLIQEDFFWKEIDRFYDVAPRLFASTLEWLALEPSGVSQS